MLKTLRIILTIIGVILGIYDGEKKSKTQHLMIKVTGSLVSCKTVNRRWNLTTNHKLFTNKNEV
jgi:hypothetical protein